jgi:hypothetical protein
MLPSILEQLRDDRANYQEFAHLNMVLDTDGAAERDSHGRGARVNVTPQALRDLVPGRCTLPGAKANNVFVETL